MVSIKHRFKIEQAPNYGWWCWDIKQGKYLRFGGLWDERCDWFISRENLEQVLHRTTEYQKALEDEIDDSL